MAKNYYNILGVSRSAGDEEIKSAYKKLAKKYHPDVNKDHGSEEKFKEVQEAYSVLSDSGKKSQYDRFGADFEKYGGGQGGFSGFGGQGGFGAAPDLEDLFESMGFGGGGFSDLFGGSMGGQRQGPKRGQDIAVRLEISFEEAVFGAKKDIELERVEECDNCKGSGARPGTKVIACDVCHGSGVENSVRRTFLGTIQTQTTCRRCRGSGQAVGDPCPVCSGAGRVSRRKKITVEIPEGVDSGTQLRLKNQGNAGEKGAGRGNLIVVLNVLPHEIFKREGNDVYIEIPVSYSEAALGTEVEIPTLKGKAALKVPAGTQSATTFRMHGKGVKSLQGSGHGDQYTKVVVKTPEKLTKKQKELLESLGREEKIQKERKGLFGKLEGMFE